MLWLLACTSDNAGVDHGSFTYPFGASDTGHVVDSQDDDTPGPCPIEVREGESIQAAFDNLRGCDEVVAIGSFTEELVLSEEILFRGEDAQIVGALLVEADATVRDLSFASGTGVDGPGRLSRYQRYGGGLFVYKADPILETLLFEDNSAVQGGGAYLYEFGGRLSDSTFRGNTSTSNESWGGGAIYCYDCDGVVETSLFEANEHTADGGSGGALMLRKGSPVVDRNVFVGNRADATGGCVRSSDGEPTITNNLFVDCDPDGIVVSYTDAGLVAHNTIMNSTSQGLRIHCPDCTEDGPTTSFVNNVVVGSGFYGVKVTGHNEVTWQTNALWNNTSGDYDGLDATDDVLEDPLLDEDGRPGEGSPLIDAGTATEVVEDLEGTPRDEAPDIGAYESVP